MSHKDSNKDIFAVMVDFNQNVLQHMPSVSTMREEVSMMDFKIRPVQGDISALDLTSNKFIEALWCMGKLDELYQNDICDYEESDRELFSQFTTNIQNRYTSELQRLVSTQTNKQEKAPYVEIEIYRETVNKQGMN